MLEWGHDTLAMPVVAPWPSSSNKLKIKREHMQGGELLSSNTPRIKRERPQEDELRTPRMKHEDELRTPTMKGEEELRTPVRTPPPVKRNCPNSSVKVSCGPWEEHLRDHCVPSGRCYKCMWASNRKCWFQRTPLDLKSGVRRTWLQARPINTPDSEWGVGCRACSWALLQQPHGVEVCRRPYVTLSVTGDGLRLSNFKRHAQTAAHKEAVIGYLHRAADSEAIGGFTLLATAPPVEDFANAWLDLRKGIQAKNRKRRTLEWCLFEAVRDRELSFLGKATCISIMLDERNGRLLIKYSATDRHLDVRVGCLAQIRDAGGTACGVAEAVHTAVSRFCTRRVLHAGLNAGRNRRAPNLEVQVHIRNTIEMFTADGASNEQLAGKMLHPASLRGDLALKLPSLRLVLRDKAHATRRLTERTFACDNCLGRIMQAVVLGQGSVSRLLKNSRRLQCIFEEEVNKQDRVLGGIQSSVRNMSFAKQRFDSTAKPLGRCLLNLDAVISMMNIVCGEYPATSNEHRGAAEFLHVLSHEANLILLGMLADASDECLLLTRFFDKEAFKLEEMAEQMAAFTRKLQWLFAEKGCLQTGYTSLALRHLTRTKMVPIPGQVPVTLGGRGATPAVVTECLGRMVAWSNLATEVAASEFPEFEVLACFRVFKLAPVAAPSPAPGVSAGQTEQLQRLAETFKVDGGANLIEQFMEHQRIAQTDQVPGEPAAASWQRALKKTQATSRRRKVFQADALSALLQRFVVSPGSTSGVEQNFSMFKRSLGQHWQGSELAEERRLVLQLASGITPDADRDLLVAARLIWSTVFGLPRPGRGPKPLVRCIRRPQGIQSAAAWLRHRRQHVADCSAAAIPAKDQAVEAAAAAAWTDRHDAEVRFQKKARLEHKCADVHHGILSQCSLGPGAEEALISYRETEVDREAKLVAKRRVLDRKRAPPEMPDLQGRRVFMAEDAKAVLNRAPAQLALALQRSHLLVVEDRAVASLFCVLNPSEPGDRVRTVAAQTGAVICTPEMLLTNSGVALTLQRAISWPRHIFLSTNCHNRHQVIIDLVRRVCALNEGCRWTWYLEADGPDRRALFLARAQKRRGNHRSELVTLLAPGQDAAFHQFPNRMILSRFLAAIYRVDACFTWLGICGR